VIIALYIMKEFAMLIKTSWIKNFFINSLAALTVGLGTFCFADNSIIQTKFTADPAPMVYNDTVFLYTSHDENDATGFHMKNWLLYTSTDMVNWTDRGIVASLKDFKWVKETNGAWAPQCINRNGKFYLYCPMPNKVLGFGNIKECIIWHTLQLAVLKESGMR
jgi:arabinoxylan arabinofuranohydrolase